MNRTTLILFLLLISHTISAAQEVENEKAYPTFYLGIGTGLDYGGLGTKFEYIPIKWIGITAGVGFNFHSYGLNAGVSFYPLSDKKLQPLATLLYGYNAVIIIANRPQLSETYYGFSPGIGGLLKTGKRGNKLYLGIFYPLRNQSFQSDYQALKTNPYFRMDNELPPISISIGFNFAI